MKWLFECRDKGGVYAKDVVYHAILETVQELLLRLCVCRLGKYGFSKIEVEDLMQVDHVRKNPLLSRIILSNNLWGVI